MANNKFHAAFALVAGLGITLIVGCTAKTTPNAQGAPNDSPLGNATVVETVSVKREDLRRVSEATPAELMPYEATDLYANITGFLNKIDVDYGDTVKPDQVLAVISAPEMEKSLEQKKAMVDRAMATIEQTQAALKAAEARLETTKAAYERWESEYNRVAGLVRDKVIDAQTRDEALNQLKAASAAHKESAAKRDLAEADVRVAHAQRKIAEAETGEIEALLQYAQIKAPYAGVVTKRYLHSGAFINAKSGGQPILSVMRTDILRLVAEVPEKDVRFLKDGGEIEVDLDAFPDKKFTWTISRMAPILGLGKKARVEAEIRNDDKTFYPGMYGHAVVVLEKNPQTLTLPSSCILTDARGAFVWSVEQDKAVRKPVKTGINDGKKVEIVSGLTGAEAIVHSGKEGLKEGQSVQARMDANTK
jgi:multidrug efflux pump subunit AcrA (membrane-fusion protein)